MRDCSTLRLDYKEAGYLFSAFLLFVHLKNTGKIYNTVYNLQFMNLSNHKNIGALGDFTKQVASLISEVSNTQTGTESERADIKNIEMILKNALKGHPEMFNTWTALSNRADSRFLQNYYDLSKLTSNSEVLEAQFLNIFPYIAASARENDIIMIHGMNQLSVGTWDFLFLSCS